ncbi:MAG: hypothetical protein V3576_05575, partial [Candidatus Cloacimonadota bacterium]
NDGEQQRIILADHGNKPTREKPCRGAHLIAMGGSPSIWAAYVYHYQISISPALKTNAFKAGGIE